MYTRVLIPVDGSPSSEHAAKLGLALAQQLDATVVFVTVSAFKPYLVKPEDYAAFSAPQTLLNRWESQAKQKYVLANTILVLKERALVVETLLDLCRSENCDLIVLGTGDHKGLSKVLLGTVAERTARLAQVPVLLVRDNDSQLSWIKNILLATDGSSYSSLALEHADSIANRLDAKLTILNVAPNIDQLPLGFGRAWMFSDVTPIQKQLDNYIAELKANGNELLDQSRKQCQSTHVSTLLKEGRHRLSSEVISEVANEINADLIVMGTHGYTGLRKFLLGSVASEVAHSAKQPVLLVRNLKSIKS